MSQEQRFEATTVVLMRAGLRTLYPDRIVLEGDRLRVLKRTWFRLGKIDKEFQLEELASIDFEPGVLSATVVIRTKDGNPRSLKVNTLASVPAQRLVEAARQRMGQP